MWWFSSELMELENLPILPRFSLVNYGVSLSFFISLFEDEILSDRLCSNGNLQVAYWLQQHDIKVMMAACDTFRSGAVEQLRTHARRLQVYL